MDLRARDTAWVRLKPDVRGHPVREMGIVQPPQDGTVQGGPMAGAVWPECGNATVRRKDGCDFCAACGHVGSCG
ncbi:MAG TPA: hypothetical protein VFL86_27225 [Burkholderiaceae bacterium]|nr:hypothetical protein [Burkholderiaceae bacterium]